METIKTVFFPAMLVCLRWHIVAIFGSEGLFCFDTDGKLIWKKSLGPMDSGVKALSWESCP